MLDKSEFRNYHEREVTRLRSLLETATTPALRARLLEQAEQHERLAGELDDLKAAVVTIDFSEPHPWSP